MNISGIQKLRYMITFLLFCYIMIYIIAIIQLNIEDDADLEWINSLNDDEVDTLLDLYDRYPTTNTSGFNNILLILNWSIGGGLFIVFLKVWRTEVINNKIQATLNYNTFKRDVVGVSLIEVQCSQCNTIFSTKKNIGIPTETICPVCQTKGYVMHDS